MKIKTTPSVLSFVKEEPTYIKTQEIMRYKNEIARVSGDINPSFSICKKAILKCATLRFLACKENKSIAYSDYIKSDILSVAEHGLVDANFIKKTISKICIDKNGTTTVEFINGTNITDLAGKEDIYARASEENRNQD